MDTQVIKELQLQMNRERYNAEVYMRIADRCKSMMFDGLGDFFYKQAQEEIGHSVKFADFLISQRIVPQYSNGITSVGPLPDGLQAITVYAYNLEVGTTANLRNIYEVAESAQESQVCALLDALLLEQVEEEQWSYDLMDMVRSNDEGGWLIINQLYK